MEALTVLRYEARSVAPLLPAIASPHWRICLLFQMVRGQKYDLVLLPHGRALFR
jgi:hypothetical protein